MKPPAAIRQNSAHPTSPSTIPPQESGRSRPRHAKFLRAGSPALLIFLASCCGTDSTPRPFTTDGCSAFPDGTPSQPTAWQHHCIAHDHAYWAGGTRDERRAADRALSQNLKADGHRFAGTLTHLGTRIGGHPLFPTCWRWGYAWKYGRGYRPLSDDERGALEATAQPAPSSCD